MELAPYTKYHTIRSLGTSVVTTKNLRQILNLDPDVCVSQENENWVEISPRDRDNITKNLDPDYLDIFTGLAKEIRKGACPKKEQFKHNIFVSALFGGKGGPSVFTITGSIISTPGPHGLFKPPRYMPRECPRRTHTGHA